MDIGREVRDATPATQPPKGVSASGPPTGAHTEGGPVLPPATMPSRTVQGDLIALALDGRFDVIVHGCNCMCVMGAGIAKAVKAAFPEAYAADRFTKRGDRGKLGTVSTASVRRGPREFVVVNGYTQHHWRGMPPLVEYDAIRQVMRTIARRWPSARVGYPKIGAGLAGGDWGTIAHIIDEELQGVDHTLVEFNG